MKRYVQHISGQGEKWEVRSIYPTYYLVYALSDNPMCYAYPKSEYVLCEPPEGWEDVTDGCMVDSAISLSSDRGLSILHALDRTYRVDVLHKSHVNHYRVRKIDHLHNGPAFIIERKK